MTQPRVLHFLQFWNIRCNMECKTCGRVFSDFFFILLSYVLGNELQVAQITNDTFVFGQCIAFYKILKKKKKNMRLRRIICGPQKVCVAAYFFIYFPKSFFQHFENWKIRSRVKFYAHVFLIKKHKRLVVR